MYYLNSIGNTALFRYREVVRFSEGPLSEARLYMEWPAAGYFHWLSSIVIAPPVVHSLQPHYRLSQLASTVWLVQK